MPFKDTTIELLTVTWCWPSLASSEVLAVRYAVRLWHPSCLAFAAPARIRNEL